MSSPLRIVVGIIGIVVLMVIFPMVMTATHDLQTNEVTDTGLTVSGNKCTLTRDLWNADIDSVVSITSNSTSYQATAYNEATKELTISLASGTADIVYEIDALTSFTGMGPLVGITPLLIWVALLATVIGMIWTGVRGKG